MNLKNLISTSIKDPYKAQQALIFNKIVLSFGIILGLVCAVLIIHNYFNGSYLNQISLVNGILVMGGVFASYLLSRKGHYYLGIYLFLIIITICTSFAMINKGLSFAIILVYSISVVMAGLLIGPKSSIVFAAFSIVNYGYVFHWHVYNNNLAPSELADIDILNILAFVSSMTVLTLLTALISRGLKHRVSELQRINRQRVKAMKEAQKALNEKEILMREIHHRVKNNLQVISSLLSLQSSQHGDTGVHKMLAETQSRVKSMAMIHEKLYMASDISHIDFDEYLKVLVNHMAMSYLIDPESVKVNVDVDDIVLDVDTAISCGLVINELVSNSMKHAFKDRADGIINISMKADEAHDSLALTIEDDGIGMPASLDIRNLESLGLQLVDTLVCEMKGNVRLISKEGTKFIITIPYSVSRGD